MTDPTEADREFVRELFGSQADPDETDTPKTPLGYAAREGGNPHPPQGTDPEMHEFLTRLFDLPE